MTEQASEARAAHITLVLLLAVHEDTVSTHSTRPPQADRTARAPRTRPAHRRAAGRAGRVPTFGRYCRVRVEVGAAGCSEPGRAGSRPVKAAVAPLRGRLRRALTGHPRPARPGTAPAALRGGSPREPAMDLPSCTDLDDDLFPFCTAQTVGALHTDQCRVLWVCDLVDGLGGVWVSLEPAASPAPGPR